MFPLNNNDPYIDSNGARSTLGDAIGSGGGGDPYVLPTATAERLGGVKIGDGVNVSEDGTISVSGGGGGSSIVCKRGTQNFNLSANGWNSFLANFGSDFEDTNYTWLYSITVTSAQTDSSKIPINILVKTKMSVLFQVASIMLMMKL